MGPAVKAQQGRGSVGNRPPRPAVAAPGELEQFARHLEENIRRWTIGTSGGRRASSTFPERTRRRSSVSVLPTLNTDTAPVLSADPLPYFTESPVDESPGASPFRRDGDRTPTTASPTGPGVAHSPGARSEDLPPPSEADTPLSSGEAVAPEPDLPPRPCGCSQMSRNLVVCIDGTSNKFGLKNTNVVELYSLLLKDGNQLTYYDSGIGTYAKPSWKKLSYLRRVFDHKIDLAIAWNFERILLGAYRWLAEHYREGDTIFLFGFSRGAYQVRALSAMIDRVGLIHRGNEAQIPFAFELFASIDDIQFPEDATFDATAEGDAEGNGNLPESPQIPTNKSETVQMAEHFKQTFSRVVQVHFVGAWDTVSSVGIVRNKVLPGAASGMRHICYFRHGLALDERRVKFLPEFANGGSTLKANRGDMGLEKDGEFGEPRVKEVWFAGTHSNMRWECPQFEYGPPLRWMSYEATKHGLRMHPFRGYWSLDKSMEVHESLKGFWKLFEFLPIKRLSYKDSDSSVWWPHLGRGRQIQPGQSIHSSVFRRDSDAYISHAVLPYPARNKSEDWKNLQDSLSQGNLQITLEKDLYGTVSYLVEQSKRHLEDAALNKKEIVTDLFKMMMSAEGRRALHEVPDAAQHIVPLFWNAGKAPVSESRKAATIFITMDIRLLAAFLYAQSMYANKIYLTADKDDADLSLAVIQLNGEFVRCETSDESVMHISIDSIHNALPRIFSVVQVLRRRRNANARLIAYQPKR